MRTQASALNCNVLPVGQVGTGWDAGVLQLSMEWGEVCHLCLILNIRLFSKWGKRGVETVISHSMVLEDEAVKHLCYFNSQELAADKCSSRPALWRDNQNVGQVCIVKTSYQCVIIEEVDKICISYKLVQSILKWPENWRNSCIMHHGTMPFDASRTVQTLLVKTPIPTIPHWLYLRLQIGLECRCLVSVGEIQQNVTAGCSHTKTGLPAVLLGIAGLWEQVCICWRPVWWWLVRFYTFPFY